MVYSAGSSVRSTDTTDGSDEETLTPLKAASSLSARSVTVFHAVTTGGSS